MTRGNQTKLKSQIKIRMDRPEKKCAQCFIPCETKCSKCVKVWYCGVEHQKLHWKTHKNNCFPAMELTDNRHGHYLASTRKILAGEIIFTEGPLVLAPFVSNKERFPVCLGCCKVLPGQFGDGEHGCQKCSWPLCKHDCEKISCHSGNECKIFQAQKVKPSDIIQLATALDADAIYDGIKIIRILLLMGSEPEKFDKFLQLESHEQLREWSDIGVLQTNFILAMIHNCCKMSPILYTADLINKLLGVVLANSIRESGCTNIPGNSCESFIFERGSKLCHNCVSNTKSVMKYKNKSRGVFAVTEIEKGEMLTECYGFDDIYWKGIVERRQGLHEMYHFWCTCLRCSDRTELGTYLSAIKCKGGNCCGLYLPRNPTSTDGDDSVWKCNWINCRNAEKYSKLSKTVFEIEDEIEKSKTVEEKLSIIEKHANVSVHENHFTLMKLRYDLLPKLLLKLHIDDQTGLEYVRTCKKTVEFAEKCLEIANKLAPGLSVHRGILLFYLAQGSDKSIEVSGMDPMSKLKALKWSVPIREEAKRILELMPEGTAGHTIYQTLAKQDNEFSKGVDMVMNVMKQMQMGLP